VKVCHINLARGFRGGERQTELLITQLWRRGDIRQKAIVRNDSPLLPRLRRLDGLEVVPVGKPYIRHTRLIKDCSLIHVHEAKAGQFAYLATRMYKRPYLITRRVPNPLKANPLTRRVYAEASRIVALSGAIRKGLVDYDPFLDPVVIPSMVASLPADSESAAEIRARYRDKFLVGHAGALVNHHKGQQYIVEAAALIRQVFPQIHFLLLGRGKDEHWLKSMAAELENLEFLGFVENVGDYLAAFDLFVFPSLQEGLGSVLLDAMHFGLPVVASEVGGIPDIIAHGENGLLVPPADSRALAEAIVYLYKNSKMRRQLSDNAYSASRGYHPEALALQYFRLYQEILGPVYA